MICKPNELPGMPAGDVIMIKRDIPIEETEGGLIIPRDAQHLECFGTILHAGLAARDIMFDNGHEIGDYIRFGKYASTLDEWDYLVDEPDPACAHDEWTWVQGGTYIQKKKCSKCGANRSIEAIALMKVEDIKVNETLERRFREGKMRIVRKETTAGTQHFIERAPFEVIPASITTTLEVANERVRSAS